MTLGKKSFENIMVKGENDGNRFFYFSHKVFSHIKDRNIKDRNDISGAYKLSFVDAFNLV